MGLLYGSARVLVTGAAGFIGSHLVERLLEQGHEVLGVDSFEDYYPRPLKERNLQVARAHPHYRFLERNLLALGRLEPSGGDGPSELEDLCSQVDVVFHLAAQAGVRASWGRSFDVYTDNNVRATQLLLEACLASGVKKFVYASSSSVYGESDRLPLQEDAPCIPLSPYGVTKLAGENLARLYWKCHGVPTVCLRFFTVYGPRQRPDMAFNIFLRSILEDRPLRVFGDGRQTRDFTHVSDIVEGLVLAPDAPDGSVINIGGGSRVSLHEVIALLGDVTGRRVTLAGESRQSGDVTHTWADLSRASDTLGYRPRVHLEEGLRTEYEWLRAQPRTQTGTVGHG